MGRIGDCARSLKFFLTGSFFDERYTLKVHIAQMVLVVAIIAFTGARIATKPAGFPVTRSDMIGIIMGVKTAVVLTYQLVTTHVNSMKRWASARAYMILNFLEILFWFVVIILTFMGISRSCEGANCGLSWGAVLVSLLLMLLAMWTAVSSYNYFRYTKKAAMRDHQSHV